MDTFDLLPSLADGEIAESSAPELVAAIFRSHASGTLTIEAPETGEVRQFFRAGQMCGSAYFIGFRTLAQVLLEQEWAQALDVDASFAEAQSQGRRHGELLLEKGLLTAEQLAHALSAQHRHNLLALLRMDRGHYELRGWEPPPAWSRELNIDPIGPMFDALEEKRLAPRRAHLLTWLGGHTVRLTPDWEDIASRAQLPTTDHRAIAQLARPRTHSEFLAVTHLPHERAEALMTGLLLIGAAEPVASAPLQSRPPSQPVSRPPSQPVSRPPSQPVSRPPSQPVSRPPSQPVSRPPSQPVSRPPSQPVSRPPSQPVSRPPSQPVSRPPSQPVSRPLSQPVSRPPSFSRPPPPPPSEDEDFELLEESPAAPQPPAAPARPRKIDYGIPPAGFGPEIEHGFHVETAAAYAAPDPNAIPIDQEVEALDIVSDRHGFAPPFEGSGGIAFSSNPGVLELDHRATAMQQQQESGGELPLDPSGMQFDQAPDEMQLEASPSARDASADPGEVPLETDANGLMADADLSGQPLVASDFAQGDLDAAAMRAPPEAAFQSTELTMDANMEAGLVAALDANAPRQQPIEEAKVTPSTTDDLRKKLRLRGLRNLSGVTPRAEEEEAPQTEYTKPAQLKHELSQDEQRFIDEVRARVRSLPAQNPWQRLGVSRKATTEQIHAAYLEAVKRYHPDRGAILGRAEVQEELRVLFGAIKEAHDRIGTSSARQSYTATSASSPGASPRQEESLLALRMGEVLLKKRDFAAAMVKLRRAAELDPSGDTLAALAWGLLCDPTATPAKRSEAEMLIDRSLRVGGASARTHYVAGVSWRARDPAAATEAFRRALEIDPNHPGAAQELRLLEMRQSKKAGISAPIRPGKKK